MIVHPSRRQRLAARSRRRAAIRWPVGCQKWLTLDRQHCSLWSRPPTVAVRRDCRHIASMEDRSHETDKQPPGAADATIRPQPDLPREIGGTKGPEPTRYGDWERNGRVSDF